MVLLLCCDFMRWWWPWWWGWWSASLSPVFRRISQSDFAEECIVFLLASNCIETTYNALTQLKAIVKIVFFIVQKRCFSGMQADDAYLLFSLFLWNLFDTRKHFFFQWFLYSKNSEMFDIFLQQMNEDKYIRISLELITSLWLNLYTEFCCYC